MDDSIYFGVPIGEGGYEYKPLGHIEEVELTPVDVRDTASLFPRPGEDMYSHFITVKGGTRMGWCAVTEAIWHNNLLYLDFPKKTRRKLRKYARQRKRMHFLRKRYDGNPFYLYPEAIREKIFDPTTKLKDEILENYRKYLINSRVIPFNGAFEPGYIRIKKEEENDRNNILGNMDVTSCI